MITECIYVGDPDWDVPPGTLSGSPEQVAESLNEFGAMGVSHLQVRLRVALDRRAVRPDGRGSATEVGPHLTR